MHRSSTLIKGRMINEEETHIFGRDGRISDYYRNQDISPIPVG